MLIFFITQTVSWQNRLTLFRESNIWIIGWWPSHLWAFNSWRSMNLNFLYRPFPVKEQVNRKLIIRIFNEKLCEIKNIFPITMEFTVYITYLSVALLSLFHLFLLQEEYSSCNVDNHYWVCIILETN